MDRPISDFITWDEIKAEFPEVAKFFVELHRKNNGFIIREPGFIYLIHAVGSNFYKIGKTTNPDRRILQIAPQMPFLTRYIRVWRSDFMSIAEKMLHEWFEGARTNGEWFELGREDLVGLVGSFREIQYAYFYEVLELVDEILRKDIPDHWSHKEKRTAGDRFPTGISGFLVVGSTWIEQCLAGVSNDLMPSLPDPISADVLAHKHRWGSL